VLELDPPRRLTFTWGEERLRFELEPVGEDRTRLRLTHFLSSREQAARDAAGWHVCLDRLADHLRGDVAQAPTSEATAEWREHYETYRRRGLPAGAPVPG
jgi:Activator of Hsp90 ATPase homolog 1-like protein